MSKTNKSEPVSLEVLMRICQVFHCDIGDIYEVILDENLNTKVIIDKSSSVVICIVPPFATQTHTTTPFISPEK